VVETRHALSIHIPTILYLLQMMVNEGRHKAAAYSAICFKD
jgi:hypothetical protein